MCGCGCGCAGACVRACMGASMRVRVCVRACMCGQVLAGGCGQRVLFYTPSFAQKHKNTETYRDTQTRTPRMYTDTHTHTHTPMTHGRRQTCSGRSTQILPEGCVCLCVCACTCACAHVRVCARVRARVCMWVWTYANTAHTRAWVRVNTHRNNPVHESGEEVPELLDIIQHLCVCACVRACVCVCVCVRACARTCEGQHAHETHLPAARPRTPRS